MKILIVCSGNSGNVSSFIKEQAESLKRPNLEVSYFIIRGKGCKGYLKNYRRLLHTIRKFRPSLIHAHYGLSGLLSVLQRKVPVVITFHGSDIHQIKNLKFSKLAIKFSKIQIFVSEKLKDIAKCKQGLVIPCGVDTSIFYSRNKIDCRQSMNLNKEKRYILFSSAFDNPIKNAALARKAVQNSGLNNLEILELKGYKRDEVSLMLNAVDLLLMTSYSEGSPQIIKEAMSCNIPIVSTNVGDVEWLFSDLEGHFLTNQTPEGVVEGIKSALNFSQQKFKTEGRNRIIELELDKNVVGKKIIDLYKTIIT